MERPIVTFTGQDGNIFNLIAIASSALSKVGLDGQAKEMRDRIYGTAKNYNEALCIINDYVDVE